MLGQEIKWSWKAHVHVKELMKEPTKGIMSEVLTAIACQAWLVWGPLVYIIFTTNSWAGMGTPSPVNLPQAYIWRGTDRANCGHRQGPCPSAPQPSSLVSEAREQHG